MDLTRSFRRIIIARALRDPAFAKALLAEAEALTELGEHDVARSILLGSGMVHPHETGASTVTPGISAPCLEAHVDNPAVAKPASEIGPSLTADDGPLSKSQWEAVRADAAGHLPKGELLCKDSLFSR